MACHGVLTQWQGIKTCHINIMSTSLVCYNLNLKRWAGATKTLDFSLKGVCKPLAKYKFSAERPLWYFLLLL